MKKALIIGMAKSGIGAAKLLCSLGYEVVINDGKSQIDGLEEALHGCPVKWRLGCDPMELLDKVELMVLSPAVPMSRPFIAEARRRGIEVISEIELGYRYSKAEFVCITGTNGKTTCTALTGEIFKAAGYHTFVLGNIGIPITEHAMETVEGDIIVAETAALQLEGNVHFHCHSAGVCNITPDHIDHFGSMENYIAAKRMILLNQTAEDWAILNADDPTVCAFANDTPAKVLYFSRKKPVESGMYCIDGLLRYNVASKSGVLMPADEIRIPGAHNVENAMLCALLALSYDIEPGIIANCLRSFPGVEHRIEYVCTRGGVDYINDSKGTNPDSTIRAIQAMKKPTVLLLGGYDKHGEFDTLFAEFTPLIKGCVLLGATADKIYAAACQAGYGELCHRAKCFKEAVDMARELCVPGDVVLLSPACASWGMFKNFEQRGEIFCEIVRAYED